MPKVSVAIIAYNTAHYVGEAVASILAQTYKDFELIVVDDGSLDATAEIVAAYSDKRIRLIRLPENRGRAVARNVALDAAQGEYLAWLDSDDTCTANRLAKQVCFLERHPEVSAVSAARRCFGAGKGIIRLPPDYESIRAKILLGTALTTGVSCWRLPDIRKYGLRFNEIWNRGEDMVFWADFLLKTPLRAINMQDILLNYRVGPRPDDVYWHRETLRYILNTLNIIYTETELRIHGQLCGAVQGAVEQNGAEPVLDWMLSLTQQYKKNCDFPVSDLYALLSPIAKKAISFSPKPLTLLRRYSLFFSDDGPHWQLAAASRILLIKAKRRIKNLIK